MSTNSTAVILKPGRDKHVRNRHPWVFIGAIESLPKFENGGLLPVLTTYGEFIGYGYFNKGQSISGRMVSFENSNPLVAIENSIAIAMKLRAEFMPEQTNAYRIINGEGDNLPGLIVDKYGDYLSVQFNTLGMEKLKPVILKQLNDELKPKGIYEKSTSATRKKEGLEIMEGWISGEPKNVIEIIEHGIKFKLEFCNSQKTGLFLDQREMRKLVRETAKDRKVLNCFSYTGGFSVYAMKGGADMVDSIDISKSAIESAKENFGLNKLKFLESSFYVEDVTAFLRATELPKPYDYIILDPPAFAKKSRDVAHATKGYREINRLALAHLPKGGLLLTSSCSSHIDREQFQTIVFQAAKDAKRNVRVLSYHVLGFDHPLNLYYREGDYLKSLLLYVD